MADKLRVGIVGCGGIARAHLAGYRNAEDVEVVSVFDVAAPAAQALAAESGARVAESIADMIRLDKPDAVSICTPPGVHLANSAPFLAAGIPVLCEKPLELNARTAAKLAAAAQRSRALFMTAFCHRFHPAIVELKKLIDAGTLGKPVLFRNIFGGYIDMKGNHRARPEMSGGGVIVDNGSHSVDLFRFLVGEPTSVQAMAGHVAQKLPIEDFGMIALERNGKVFGEILSSYSLKVCGNWVEWYGTRGTAAVSYWNEGQPDLACKVEGAQGWTAVDCSALPDRFTAEVGHFITCIRTGRRKPAVSASDGYRAAVIIQAAYQSVAKGKRIAVRYT